MNAREQVARFDCRGETLMGVLSSPADDSAAAQDVAVVIVVGGPQYRAGSHRQFVLLARTLAAAGYATLRFDQRGMGDSTGSPVCFEETGSDIAAAIDALRRACPQVRRVVLWGLCDGASAALLYMKESADPRVGGLILLNPWIRSEETLARTHLKHYYVQRLGQRAFWSKLLRGGVARKAAGELARSLATVFGAAPPAADAVSTFQQKMLYGLTAFDGPVALMLSGNDYTAREFVEHARTDPSWRACLARTTTTRVDFDGADHTFSGRDSQAALEAATVAWLDRATARQAA